jgi:ribosomal protein S14
MKKKLTLDETWELCLKMWKWIDEGTNGNEYNLDSPVEELKGVWLDGHHIDEITGDCLFCSYKHSHGGDALDDCSKCPAKKVDKSFTCLSEECNYKYRPRAFYRKLVALNKKRLAKKGAK